MALTDWHRGILRLGLVALLLCRPAVAADSPAGPRPPCAGAPMPDSPKAGEAPHIRLWKGSELGTAPACTPWEGTSLAVELTGHFHLAGAAEGLLTRMGAITSLSLVRYWSVSDGRWNNLFEHARALSAPDPKKVRTDFSAAELGPGANVYFAAADNRTGRDAVWRLAVREAAEGHLALMTENVTPLRWGLFTYARPGGWQTWYFLDRQGDGSWRFYSLTSVRYASALIAGVIPEKSYVNRAVAMYRHLSGVPTDRDPPAAP